jgi:hypothetical protein
MGLLPVRWASLVKARRSLCSAALLLLVAAPAVAGCGGSDDSTTVQQLPRLSKGQFVKKTNDICFANSQAQAEKVEAFKKKHHITATIPALPVQEKMIVEVILPFVHKTVGELEELQGEARPPKGEGATLVEFIAALKKATAISEKTPRWLAEPSKDYEPFMEARELAGEMGTYLCGQA